ncbi:hypothetical protein TNCV_301961 [Trichonephila clavipes]|nr:hypothetical protein TNCV_301961 [Trichonephila clavipes]
MITKSPKWSPKMMPTALSPIFRKNVVESELVQEPQHQVPYVEGSEEATLSNYSDFYLHRLAHEELQINHKSLIT